MDIVTTEIIRPYEGVLILHPEMTEDSQKDLFRRIDELIKGFKGTVGEVHSWGTRYLGNPINKVKNAEYFYMTFSAKPDCILELERTLRINDKVLRFLFTRLSEKKSLSEHTEEYKTMIQAEIERAAKKIEKFSEGREG